MVDIGMIIDVANSIALHRAQPPTSLSMTHFKRLFILAKPVERPIMSVDIDFFSQKVDPTTTTGNEGVTDTSTLVSASTSSPARAFISSSLIVFYFGECALRVLIGSG